MSLDRLRSGPERERRSSVPDSKALKRDHNQVSPNSPESAITLTSIKTLLKEALAPITDDLNELKKSVDFTSDQLKIVTSLEERVADLQINNCELSNQLKDSKAKCNVLEEKVIALESYSRRNNLKFSQIRGTTSELQNPNKVDCESLMVHLFQRAGIDMGHSDIKNAHYIGYHKQVDRPIIVRFLSFKMRQKVYTERSKLKELGVFVSEDYPKEVIERRKFFQPTLQAAYHSGGKYKAHLIMDKLILNGKAFTCSEMDKLPSEIQPQNICNNVKTGFFHTEFPILKPSQVFLLP